MTSLKYFSKAKPLKILYSKDPHKKVSPSLLNDLIRPTYRLGV